MNKTESFTIIPPIVTDQSHVREIITKVFGELTDEQFKDLFPLFEWIKIKAGNQLIKQGDRSNYIYFLTYGRLTAIREREHEENIILGDIFPGQAVGESSVIADQPNSAHVFSAKDSILIRLSKEELYKLGNKFPNLAFNIAKTIIHRADKNSKSKKHSQPKNIVFIANKDTDIKGEFNKKLQTEFKKYGEIQFLDRETIFNKVGLDAENESAQYEGDELNIRLQKELDKIENNSDYVIYYASEKEKYWMEKVVGQADVFYILKEFEETEELSYTEEKLFSDNLKYQLTQKNLVLLHKNGKQLPKNTARFLKHRSLKLHHHIRMDQEKDIGRLGRFITGNAIGLALSGGGAKGLSHVGAVMSLREKNIPIDYFSGTSIGTLIGAVGALDLSNEELFTKGKDLAMKAPTRRKNMNIFPFVSLMKGRQMDALLEEHFGEYNIEDTWINSCYVASDLTEKKKIVIKSGPLDKAIRASISLPGIFPPSVRGNSLIVDGGMFENLPTDTLEELEMGKIIAITLNSTKKYKLEYDVIPDSWEHLKNKFIHKKKLKIPSITTVIIESMLLGSYSKYKDAISKLDLHLQPPVNKVSILDWDSYDKTVKLGIEHTDEMVTEEVKKQILNPRSKNE